MKLSTYGYNAFQELKDPTFTLPPMPEVELGSISAMILVYMFGGVE